MAFEAILSQQRAAPSGWRRIIMTFSVLLHAIALAAGIAHSIWQVEEMPLPSIEVTLAMAPPPPPPPPPPPKRSSKPKTKPVEMKPKVIVAPTQTPTAAEPEPEEPAEEDEGEDEGVEGGVIGGIAGGIVGGTAPPPPKSTGPKLLTTKAGHSLLAINTQARPYKVNVPEEFISRGEDYVAQVRMCVSADGSVSNVKILKPSALRAIDLQIPTVLGRWKYKPYLVEGRATAFCYPLNYRVRG